MSASLFHTIQDDDLMVSSVLTEACGEGARRPDLGCASRPLDGSQVGQLPPRMGAGGAKEVKGHGEEEGREEEGCEEEGREEEEEVTDGLLRDEAGHGLGGAPLLSWW